MTANQKRSKRSLKSYIFWLLIAGVAFLGIAVLVIVVGAQASWERELAAEMDRIRAAGEPVAVAELRAFYSPSEKALAAGEDWLAATQFLEGEEFESAAAGVPFLGDGWDDEGNDRFVELADWEIGGPLPNLDEAKRFLDRYREQIERLHEIATKSERIAFPLEWEEHVNMSLEHAMSQQAARRVLKLQAAVACEQGDGAAAAKCIRTILATAKAASDEPVIVSQLVRQGLDRSAAEMTSRAIARSLLNDAELFQLQETFARRDYAPGMKAALIAERVTMILAIESMGKPQGQGNGGQALPSNSLWSALENAGKAEFLKATSDMIAASDLPPREAIQELTQIENSLRTPTITSKLTNPGRIIAFMVTPPASAALRASFDSTAAARAAAVGCAVARWKLAQGNWPGDLNVLVERYPDLDVSDPWSDGSLVYRSDESGFVVYSVGPNGVDDSGDGRELSSKHYDVVFRVGPRPPASP